MLGLEAVTWRCCPFCKEVLRGWTGPGGEVDSHATTHSYTALAKRAQLSEPQFLIYEMQLIVAPMLSCGENHMRCL